MWLFASADAYKFAATKDGWSVEDTFVDDGSYDGVASIEDTFVDDESNDGVASISATNTEMTVNQLEPVDSNEILMEPTNGMWESRRYTK